MTVPRLCEVYPGICLTTEEKHLSYNYGKSNTTSQHLKTAAQQIFITYLHEIQRIKRQTTQTRCNKSNDVRKFRYVPVF